MKLEKIAIIGASGFGREVKMLIDHINIKQPKFEIIGFYDDNSAFPKKINGIPFLGNIDLLNEIDFPCHVAIAIGNPTPKKNIHKRLNNNNLSFPNLIHPNVVIGQDEVEMGKGNIICAGVVLTVNLVIKDFVILNLGCTVGHDTILSSYASLMPSVNISGEVKIEEKVYAGTGSKIINGLTIGENTIIGAGAVVSKSLPSNCTAVGIPAKPIKYNK